MMMSHTFTAEFSDHSTYEAVLDPINKVREVMRVIFPSIKRRQLTIALISLSDP